MNSVLTEVNLRPAVSSDIPELIAFEHDYNTDHVWQMAVDLDNEHVEVAFRQVRLPRPMRVGYPRNPASLADDWTRRAEVLVAERDSSCIAYLCLSFGTAPLSGWVTDLVVAPLMRRKGVATKLLAAAKQWCRLEGLQWLFLELQSKNFPAIRLAKKNGFKFSGYSDGYYPDQEIALFFRLKVN